ncbi:hypothetical protein [Aliamphritea spongicola]|uniref:hypothetical protein n=1 Tax=Aliamphritea spongicola TaxID=707589 RepID=UPI00196B2D88|nr:hypothetical protein [Aliamphritea spongicola]MBN3561008.1 hypothetical protein [Aliamphritea spongicola]
MSKHTTKPFEAPSSAIPAAALAGLELQRANTLISAGNSLLFCSVFMLLATIFIAYIIPEKVTLQIQILSHIGMLIFATGLKFGYILRLTGQHRIRKIHMHTEATANQRKKENQYGLCNA